MVARTLGATGRRPGHPPSVPAGHPPLRRAPGVVPAAGAPVMADRPPAETFVGLGAEPSSDHPVTAPPGGYRLELVEVPA